MDLHVPGAGRGLVHEYAVHHFLYSYRVSLLERSEMMILPLESQLKTKLAFRMHAQRLSSSIIRRISVATSRERGSSLTSMDKKRPRLMPRPLILLVVMGGSRRSVGSDTNVGAKFVLFQILESLRKN